MANLERIILAFQYSPLIFPNPLSIFQYPALIGRQSSPLWPSRFSFWKKRLFQKQPHIHLSPLASPFYKGFLDRYISLRHLPQTSLIG